MTFQLFDFQEKVINAFQIPRYDPEYIIDRSGPSVDSNSFAHLELLRLLFSSNINRNLK